MDSQCVGLQTGVQPAGPSTAPLPLTACNTSSKHTTPRLRDSISVDPKGRTNSAEKHYSITSRIKSAQVYRYFGANKRDLDSFNS